MIKNLKSFTNLPEIVSSNYFKLIDQMIKISLNQIFHVVQN